MELFETLKQSVNDLQSIMKNSKLDSFEYIKFKSNSDIGRLYDYLSNGLPVSLDDTLTEPQKVESVISNISTNLFDELDNKEYRNILAIFIQKIANQFKSIRGIIVYEIGPVVDDLKELISNRTKEILQRQNLGDLLNGSLDVTTDGISIFEWDGISSPSSIRQIVTSVNAIFNLYRSDNEEYFTKRAFNIVITRFFANEVIKDFKDIKIEDEELLNQLQDKMFLIDSKELKRYFTKIKNQLLDIKNIRFNIVSITKTMDTLKSQLKRMLSNTEIDQLKTNISIVLNIISLVQFCCIYYKETYFSESIIINKHIVNGPLLEKYKKEGLSLLDLAKYLRIYYLDKDLPNNGINVGLVLSANINQELERVNQAILTKRKMYLKSALSQAFKEIMLDQYDNLYDRFNGIINDINKQLEEPQYKKHVLHASKHLYGSISEVEKQLYHVIIEIFFDDTLVEMMFEVFNEKLKDTLNKLDTDTDPSANSEAILIDAYNTILLFLLKRFFIIDSNE